MAIILGVILVGAFKLFLWLLPFFVILFSKKEMDAKERVLWILATFFFSWVGFLCYIIFAPVMGKRSYS